MGGVMRRNEKVKRDPELVMSHHALLVAEAVAITRTIVVYRSAEEVEAVMQRAKAAQQRAEDFLRAELTGIRQDQDGGE
jgi:hypothetical protein